jgi:lysozyme
MQSISDLLIKHEGLRLKVYTDTTGHLTIGVGRNLTNDGISNDEAMTLLSNDISNVTNQLNSNLSWFASLDPVRQAVLQDLCFNMGWHTLSTFSEFLGFMQNGQYSEAATDLLGTLWARQVGSRATDNASMLTSGNWPDA